MISDGSKTLALSPHENFISSTSRRSRSSSRRSCSTTRRACRISGSWSGGEGRMDERERERRLRVLFWSFCSTIDLSSSKPPSRPRPLLSRFPPSLYSFAVPSHFEPFSVQAGGPRPRRRRLPARAALLARARREEDAHGPRRPEVCALVAVEGAVRATSQGPGAEQHREWFRFFLSFPFPFLSLILSGGDRASGRRRRAGGRQKGVREGETKEREKKRRGKRKEKEKSPKLKTTRTKTTKKKNRPRTST